MYKLRSKFYPQRELQFCSWVCVVHHLGHTTEWKRDPDFKIEAVNAYDGIGDSK